MHDSTTFPRRARFAPGQTITALRSSEEFFARAKTVCRFARFILFPGLFPAVSFLPVCAVSFPVFVLTVSRRAVPDCFRSAASGDALSSRGFLTSRCLPAGKFCVLSDRVFCAAGRAGNRFFRSECHDKSLSSAASLRAACRRAGLSAACFACRRVSRLPVSFEDPAGSINRFRGQGLKQRLEPFRLLPLLCA